MPEGEPEPNKIVLNYKNNPNVIFLAIALDKKYQIKDFLKTTPFAYHIIDDGREYANLYKITTYPTNLVLDKDGKVVFHATGVKSNTPYWIKKSIEEAGPLQN